MSDEVIKDVDPELKDKIEDRIPSLSTPLQQKIMSRMKILMEKMEKAKDTSNMQKSGPYDPSKHQFVNASQTPIERRFKYKKARELGMSPEDAKRFRDTHRPKMYRRLGVKTPSIKEYKTELAAFEQMEKKKQAQKLLDSVKNENSLNIKKDYYDPSEHAERLQHLSSNQLSPSHSQSARDITIKKPDFYNQSDKNYFGYSKDPKYMSRMKNLKYKEGVSEQELHPESPYYKPIPDVETRFNKQPKKENMYETIQNAFDPVKNAYALATWKAKQNGHIDFSRGSKGRLERNKEAEKSLKLQNKTINNVEKFDNIMKPTQLKMDFKSLIAKIEKEILFTMRDEKDPEGNSIGSYYHNQPTLPIHMMDEKTRQEQERDLQKNPNIKISRRINISPNKEADKAEKIPEGFETAHEIGHSISDTKKPLSPFRNLQDEMNADMSAYLKRGNKPNDLKYMKNKYGNLNGEWSDASANNLYNAVLDSGKLHYQKLLSNIKSLQKQVILEKSKTFIMKTENDLIIQDFLKEYKNKLILKGDYIDNQKLFDLAEKVNEIKKYNITRIQVEMINKSNSKDFSDSRSDSNAFGFDFNDFEHNFNVSGHNFNGSRIDSNDSGRNFNGSGLQFMSIVPPTHVAKAIYEEKVKSCHCGVNGCGSKECIKTLNKELLFRNDIKKGKGLEQGKNFWRLFEAAIKNGIENLKDDELVVLREFLYARI